MLTLLSAPLLKPQAVHVWHIPLQVSPATLAECRELLSEDERERAARFRFPEHQRRYVAARGCVRQLLACYLGGQDAASLRFAYGPAGKPELAGGGVHFNLSHSGEWALLAVSKETVGVDLEQIRTLDYDAVGREVFTADDRVALAHAPEEQKAATFFRLWVRREAQLKACGTGLGEPPCPPMPVYDLVVGAGYCAALATPALNPRIDALYPSFS